MFIEQVKNAERVQLDQIPLPDIPQQLTSRLSLTSGVENIKYTKVIIQLTLTHKIKIKKTLKDLTLLRF